MTDFGQILALVLTYNRKELVTECLNAILAQSEPPDVVLVVDNGSTDGTKEFLTGNGLLQDRRIAYHSLPRNLGPAAGFDLGIRMAYARGVDWVWIMDDDVIPAPGALEELKTAFSRNFSRTDEVGFLGSRIYSGDGKPNNVPEVDTRAAESELPDWGRLLGSGLVKIRWSTLCSVLIPRHTFTRFGSVSPDFFFSGEDVDFTLRITAEVPGYLVGRSVVTHRRAVTGVFSILTENDPTRLRMFWYSYRNQLYIRRKYYSAIRSVLFVGKSGWELLRAVKTRPYPLGRARSILGGLLAGMIFSPRHRPLEDAAPSFFASDTVGRDVMGAFSVTAPASESVSERADT